MTGTRHPLKLPELKRALLITPAGAWSCYVRPSVLHVSYMKSAITIRLEPELDRLLSRLAKQTGQSRSELVREALRRHLSLLRFETLRKSVLPFAEARGYLTDEDVYRDVS